MLLFPAFFIQNLSTVELFIALTLCFLFPVNVMDTVVPQ